MRAFSILQKWPKIAKMTPNDLLTPTMVSPEPLGKTEQNTLLVFENLLFLAIKSEKTNFTVIMLTISYRLYDIVYML